MPIPPWPKQTRKSLPTNVQRMFGGVNRIDKFNIKDNQASDMSNVSSHKYPALSTRPGYSLLGSALAARILGLATWKDTELHTISNGAWYKYASGSWGAVSGGGSLSTSQQWSFCSFKGGFADVNLIGANGSVVKRYDGSTVQNLSGAPAGLNYVDSYSDRIWGSVGNTLHFSEFRVGTNWTTTIGAESDPGFITIETPTAESINAVKAGPRRLVIFTPNSLFNLFGSSAEDFTLTPVANDIGSLSNQAVTTIEGRIYFVHQTGIYSYGGAVRPDRQFSMPVQDYIDRINPAASSKVCAGTDGKLLFIGIPLDAATEPNTVLVYNPEYDTWVVWQGYAPLNMAQMGRNIYIGGVEGQVRKVNESTTDNGSAITGYWTTKIYGSGSCSQRLMWKRAWIVAEVPVGSSLSVYLSKNPDGVSDFVLVQNAPNTANESSTRVIIPTTVAGFANFITLKFVFTGPIKIIEWSREEDQLPIY